MIQCHAITDVGKRRSQNEDNYLCDPETGLFAVADGVGGRDILGHSMAADRLVGEAGALTLRTCTTIMQLRAPRMGFTPRSS